jgi:Aldo/keto reductase family
MKDRLGVTLFRRGTLALFGAASFVPGWKRCATAQNAAAPLLTRPIPRSGEAMPVTGLGTADVFDVGDDPVRATRSAVIRSLTAAGGKLIDTAPSYGQAESVVGDLVAEAGLRRGVFLATKLEDYDHRTGPTQLRRRCDGCGRTRST